MKALSELGYQFDPSTITIHKANLFVMISEEVSKVQEQEAKKKRR